MRFVVLTQYYPPEIGAPQVRLPALAKELVALGHDVEIVTAMPNYPTGRIADGYRSKWAMCESIDGISVRRVWMYASLGRGWKRLVGYVSFTFGAGLVLMRTRRADWVFVESPPLILAVPGLLWAALHRSRSIVNVADLWPDAIVDVGAFAEDSVVTKVLRRLERWTYRRATVVNSVTEQISVDLGRRCDPAKVRFLPNGVDTEMFRPDAGVSDTIDSLGLPSSKLFVYTGNIGISQGLDQVLVAMQRVGLRDPEIVLALIGDGSARAALEAQVERDGLRNVVFVDPVPLRTVSEILPCATGAIVSLADLPTNRGARPSKMFPAMASATPVVFAGLSEGARLLEEAGAGLVAPIDDADAIADAIIRLVEDDALGKRLGQSGREFVVANYSWGAIVNSWAASLDSLTAGDACSRSPA